MPDSLGPEGTRHAILRAAEAEFGAHGYRSTTIDRIARTAGVSRALVYRYYGDKTRLYREVVATVLREWNDELVAVATDQEPTWAETLARVVRTCVEWAAERDVLRGVLVRDADLTQRLASRTMDEGRALLPALLTSLLDRGVDLGVVRRDLSVEDMAFVIAEVTIAGSFQAMSSTEPAGREARLHTIVESLLHGVLVTDATAAGPGTAGG